MKQINHIEDITCKKIYIFGAGMVAKLFAEEILQKTDIEILAFIITDNKEERYLFKHIPILSISEIKGINIPVIVATLSDAHKTIQCLLLDKKIENIFCVSESLFRNMRKNHLNLKYEIATQRIRLSELQKILSYDLEQCCVVTDEKELLSDIANRSTNIITTNYFLENIFIAEKYAAICILLLDWSLDWQKVLKKAFSYNLDVVLSYRYKYMTIEDFSLIDFAKKKDFQLSSTKRFFRDEREYYTEDVLLKFTKRSLVNMEENKLCNSCGLCMLQCQQNAISMIYDEFGYKRPRCDLKKCVQCNKCLELCPVYSIKKNNRIPLCYTYMAEDKVRLHSSSGGFFPEVSSYILGIGGVVCGAAWKSDFSVHHILIDSNKDLDKLRMSKYSRSDTTIVFPKIKEVLKKGKKVLFTGCPCQVAALKEYIKGFEENLYTIDLICAETPSNQVIKQYLVENYNFDNIKEIGFRDKTDGWRPDSFYVIDQNNNKTIKHMEDICQKAFHSRLMMPVECEHCNFAKLQREGDLTIGDAWGIPEHNSTYTDGKGTSTVLIQTENGKWLYGQVEKNAKLSVQTPIQWTYKNRTIDCVKPHPNRDRFYVELKTRGYNRAVEDAFNYKYDIGLVGNWSYPNYGSELTYFALYKVLKNMGYSVLMIEWAENSEWKPYGVTQLFEIVPYSVEEIAYISKNSFEMEKYNNQCSMFIQGSDQLLHPNLYKVYGKNVILDWVDSDKKKIGYALSFGHSSVVYNGNQRQEIAFHLDKFDAVSVREDSAVDLMKELFSIDVMQVLDPVFLCSPNLYKEVAKKYIFSKPKHILIAYILDSLEEKKYILQKISRKMGMQLEIVRDAANMHSMDVSVEKWLANIINSNFIITDSFHGMCFAIIFQKNFIAICNKNRGETRFLSILKQLGLERRLVSNILELENSKILNEKIDYQKVNVILQQKRTESMQWLVNSLNMRHKSKYSNEYCALREEFKNVVKIL